jgi:hypothetical protein
MIDNNYWISANYFQKKKIIEQWKNFPNDWHLPSRSSTEEDADRRNIKRVRISRDDNCPDGECIRIPRSSFKCHLPPIISEDTSTNDSKSLHVSLVEANHIPRCNVINPPIPSDEDNFIYCRTDVIHGVVNPNTNNITGVDNNTDTTYRANNNKRNLRSSVRKSKLSSGYCSTSPIIINDDSSVNEPVNNNSGKMPVNLGTCLVCPLPSSIFFLTTNFFIETLLEHFMSGGIQHSNSFIDGNCTIHAFIDIIYKCGEIYSSSDILKTDRSSIAIYIFLFILAEFTFTIVLNSYWPMLISMFNTLMRVEQNQSGKIKGTKVEIVELRNGTPILGRENPGICDNKLLIVWIVLCVFCIFVAAIFISAVGVSFIDLNTTSKSESICTPVISKENYTTKITRIWN